MSFTIPESARTETLAAQSAALAGAGKNGRKDGRTGSAPMSGPCGGNHEAGTRYGRWRDER